MRWSALIACGHGRGFWGGWVARKIQSVTRAKSIVWETVRGNYL